jgi:hypothetical protein
VSSSRDPTVEALHTLQREEQRPRHFETLERISLGKSYLRFFMKYIASVAGGVGARGWDRAWPRSDLRTINDQTDDAVVVNANSTEYCVAVSRTRFLGYSK